MKKLLLMLVAMIAAMTTVSAQDLYLRGDVNGWGTTNKFTNDNGTYTLQLDKLEGQFKIADANWGSNWGGGGPVPVGKEYQTYSGGSNMTLEGGVTITEVTVTFVKATAKLTITGKSQANTYEKLYLIGQLNSSSWEADRKDFPLEKVNDNTYKGTYNITTGANYFKIAAGTWTYGPAVDASGDISLNAGDKATINYPAGDKAYTIPAGEYTFVVTLDKDAAMGTLELQGKAVYPDNFYLLGDYELNGVEVHWDPSNGAPLKKTGEGVYSDEVKMVYGKDAAPAGYFSFCTQLSSTSGDWNVGSRYGAKEKDAPIALGGSAELTSGENAFAIAPGTYKITVDLVNMKVSIDPATGVAFTTENENDAVNVYSVTGAMLRKGVEASEATTNLPAGLYIVGNKKVIIK